MQSKLTQDKRAPFLNQAGRKLPTILARMLTGMLLASASFGISLALLEIPAAFAQQAARQVIGVGPTWSGVRVQYSAVRSGNQYFVAYYDAERWLTLAVISPDNNDVRRLRLPSQFGGFDSHNRVVLAIDQSNSVHVVGNMHATPLVYYKIDPPYDKPVPTAMIGRDEHRVTYPNFFADSDGNLLFFYRAGGPGDGQWILNRWSGAKWQRQSSSAIFGDRDKNLPETVSAYPGVRQAPDGGFHAAILWRRAIRQASNYRITYARSKDLVHWTDSRGNPLTLPLSPNNTDVVVDPGERSGLGQVRMGFDASNRPLILYRNQGQTGNSTFIARFENNSWRSRELGRERGSRGRMLSFLDHPTSEKVFEAKPQGTIIACVGPEGITQGCQELDSATLQPIGQAQAPEQPLREYSAGNLERSGRRAVMVMAAEDKQLRPVADAYLVWPIENPRREETKDCRRQRIDCAGATTELRLVLF